MRPQPMMRMAAAAGAGAPPVNAEGGNTDITVTVTGDAIRKVGRASARRGIAAEADRSPAYAVSLSGTTRRDRRSRVHVRASNANSDGGSGRLTK